MITSDNVDESNHHTIIQCHYGGGMLREVVNSSEIIIIQVYNAMKIFVYDKKLLKCIKRKLYIFENHAKK